MEAKITSKFLNQKIENTYRVSIDSEVYRHPFSCEQNYKQF